MHYAISTTWGGTDTTRAALPFIFAATALEKGDSVMIMLFHDAVTLATNDAYKKMVPFGPPPKFEEVLHHRNARVIVCKPCAEVRGITDNMLHGNCTMGGMGDFYDEVSRQNCKSVTF